MKKTLLATIVAMTVLFFDNCSNNKSADKKEDVNSSNIQVPYQAQLAQNYDPVYQKLQEVKDVALSIWNKYRTRDTLRWKKVKNSIEAVSFGKLNSISNNEMSISYFETGSVSTLQLLVSSPDQINLLFRNVDYLSGGKTVMVFDRKDAKINNVNLPPQARTAFIYANVDRLKEFTIHSLALCLLHELNHVYQYIYLPNMPEEEREPDAFRVQIESLKADMSPSNAKEFQKHVLDWRKKEFDLNSFRQNDFWLNSMFGQANVYIDLFAIECYGFDKTFKNLYKQSKRQ